MNQGTNSCRPVIDYPCQWLYKVIGMDHDEVQLAIEKIVADTPYEITFSNSSSSGKYLCLNLEVTVQNEEERNTIYLNLKQHPHVKIVL